MDTMTTPYVFTAWVHLSDASGTPHAFTPGDPIPEWALPLVGDHVIAEAEPAGELETFVIEDTQAPAEPVEATDPDVPRPPRPPSAGPGSGQDKWYQWAADVGAVSAAGITRSWSRQDIIDTLIRRGYLTE